MKLKKDYLFLVFLAILLTFAFPMTVGADEQPVLIVGAICYFKIFCKSSDFVQVIDNRYFYHFLFIGLTL